MESTTFGARAFARAAAVALVASFTAYVPAAGQSGNEPLIRVGFGGGVSVPVSDASVSFNNGVNGLGYAILNVFGPELPALRFAFTYDRFSFKPAAASSGNGLASITNPGTSQILGGTGGVKIHLTPGSVQPYVIGDIGAFDVRDLVNLTSGPAVSASSLNLGVDGGGGLEMKIGRFSAFVEGRIQNIFTSTSGLISRHSIQSVPVTFGVLF